MKEAVKVGEHIILYDEVMGYLLHGVVESVREVYICSLYGYKHIVNMKVLGAPRRTKRDIAEHYSFRLENKVICSYKKGLWAYLAGIFNQLQIENNLFTCCKLRCDLKSKMRKAE